MKIPYFVATCVGEFSPWGRSFVTELKQRGLLDVQVQPSVQTYLEGTATSEAHAVMVENGPKARQVLTALRQAERRLFLVWFGRTFSKEDLAFAFDQRIYCILENSRADEKGISERLSRLTAAIQGNREAEVLIRSIKSILLQSEGDIAPALMVELKKAVGKMERHAVQNEFTGVQKSNGKPEADLLFHESELLGDAILTIYGLERTGVLWVRSGTNLEGRIDFIQGTKLTASVGDVTGEKAVYRMFLWDDPKFVFTRREPDELSLEDPITIAVPVLCTEGEALRRRYEKIRAEVPPANLKLALDPNALHVGQTFTPHDFSTLASIVEHGQVACVLDYNTLSDVLLYECLIKLRKNKMVRITE